MNTKTDLPNNTTQDIAPEQITRLLTYAANQLDGDTLAALRRARHIALERQSQRRPVLALSTEHGTRWLTPHSTHQWIAAAILLVTILFGGLNYWQHMKESEQGRLDTAILTDELPLEVFVD